MSDDPAAMLAKIDVMFDEAQRRVDKTVRLFFKKMAWQVIRSTPGPGNQFPQTTEYIATGRLIGAWYADVEPHLVSARYDGGPYSDDGRDTFAQIEAWIADRPLPPAIYLNNDVAYGYLVYFGLGRHKIPRPWVETATLFAPVFAEEAIAESAQ